MFLRVSGIVGQAMVGGWGMVMSRAIGELRSIGRRRVRELLMLRLNDGGFREA